MNCESSKATLAEFKTETGAGNGNNRSSLKSTLIPIPLEISQSYFFLENRNHNKVMDNIICYTKM